jgi:glycosyltransferase involved in cell wall biosynthesis
MQIKTPIKVCLIAPLPPPYGGISHWVKMISDYAKKSKDVKLEVINTAPRGRTVFNLNLPLRLVLGVIQLFREIFQFVNRLTRKQIDVVHLTSSGGLSVARDFFMSKLASIFRVKFIYHIRFGRIPEIAAANSLEWRLITSVMRCASHVIVIDAKTFAAVKIYASDVNVALIPNCVALNFLPSCGSLESKVKVALFVGWVIPTKGIRELIEAWSIVNPCDWTLRIIGPIDFRYREELLNRFQPNNCEFLGELPHEQAMAQMSTCDLFVLPSHTEGFPNVVVEAMALGRPILATNVGAIPEMLGEGAGVLVESKNVDALVIALDALIRDSQKRTDMAKKAYLKAMSLYTIDVVFRSYLEIWEK